MQKTKTRLTTSNISFFHFLLLFSLNNKLGEFYNFANYKILSIYYKLFLTLLMAFLKNLMRAFLSFFKFFLSFIS